MTASDVLILTSYHSPSTRNRVLRGLQASGLPVTVVNKGDIRGMEDLATHSHTTAVYTHSQYTKGLERPIVIWLQEIPPNQRCSGGQWDDEQRGRLDAMSRCTAQLIIVLITPPPGTSSSSS